MQSVWRKNKPVLEKAIEIGRKSLRHASRSGSPDAIISALHGLSKAYYYHSNLEPEEHDKVEMLNESLAYRKEQIRTVGAVFPSNSWALGTGMMYAAQIETDLSKLEKDRKSKIAMLESAIAEMKKGVNLCRHWTEQRHLPNYMTSVATYEDLFGGTLGEGYLLTSEEGNLTKANEVYNDAAEDFKKADLPSRVAESYWRIAKNLDYVNDYYKASRNFENAFTAYKAAGQKISQFEDFYLGYASYMKAWSEMELGKRAHNEEKFDVAIAQYEKTSQLLRQSKSWSYLSLNFHAWSLFEQGEDLSRKERSEEAVEAFEKAIKFFQESKRVLSVKLENLDKNDERDLAKRLIEVSYGREEYSRGRIAIEEARVLERQKQFVASSEKYDKAAAVFQQLSMVDSEQAGKEAKPLAYLCQAWRRMTMAEARGSPIMYEEAAELFRTAKEYTSKDSAGFMVLGHSSFCKALEAGTEFEITRTMAMYEESVRHIEAAADFYLKAGFEAASDYTRATRCLFDAYVFMESAKRERDVAKQEGHYAMAAKVLETAAKYFEKAKYPSKSLQVQRLLEKVRAEKKMALSLGEIFHAPAVTSSTASFSTMHPVEEYAIGLERFELADLQVRLVQCESDVKVGSSVALRIQVVNVGKEPVSLVRIEDLVPAGFQLIEKPDYCQFEDLQLTMRGKRLDPLRVEELSLTLKVFKKGTIEIKPRIVCVDQIGRQTAYYPEQVVFNVSGAVLPNRVSTGYPDLDSLLFGGIPENYAVVLASPSSDERERLIRRFLEAGVKNGQTTYYVTSEVGNVIDLAEDFQSNFSLFLCNPRADMMVQSLPNVFKLKGVESLTDIDIALLKSFRSLAGGRSGPKRICITIISDVLLQHHAVIARKWLNGLIPDLKAQGFTTLAVINPEMHSSEEFQAILGLFEGEIRISEKETDKGLEKLLRIRKLYNQRYLESEIGLTREKLEC